MRSSASFEIFPSTKACCVYDGVSAGARNRADGALHPKVLLRESVSGSLVFDDWGELLLDCPNENCCGGMVNWVTSRQPAGGEDVSWGYCDSCGTFVFSCRDCGEVESTELGSAECFTCGAKYELETVDYQSTEIGDVFQAGGFVQERRRRHSVTTTRSS